MANCINEVGKRYGRWEVLSKGGKAADRHQLWLCKCDCGTIKEVVGKQLRNGTTKSCGCLSLEVIKVCNITHNKSTSVEYSIWSGILYRCFNSKSSHYHRYGGRGITVCDSWKAFENFYVDMGERPYPKAQIDRINNDGNYEPNNCRWTTGMVNASNKSTNKRSLFRGENLTIAEISRIVGISEGTLWHRIDRGWKGEELAAPLKRKTDARRSRCNK